MKINLYLKTTLCLTLGLLPVSTETSWAATAAFTGKVTAVKKWDGRPKDTLVHFTVEIDYFDYLSRGGRRHVFPYAVAAVLAWRESSRLRCLWCMQLR